MLNNRRFFKPPQPPILVKPPIRGINHLPIVNDPQYRDLGMKRFIKDGVVYK